MASSILGIDYGSKRVGIAIARPDTRPERLQTLDGGAGLLDKITALVEEHNCTTVVMGLPRNLEGEDTAQTAVVRGFAEELKQAHPDLEVALQDEAMTSEAAKERLVKEGVKDPNAILDQEAAVIILEDYLHGA